MKRFLALAVLLILGAGATIRLLPSDPADWHVDLAAADFQPRAHSTFACLEPGHRYTPAWPALATLAGLDKVALATPRTQQLAASEGRITWVSRSLIWGFLDYTTAQVMPDGETLCLYARQRFGPMDWGVNRARLQGWLQEALGLNEAPDI
jgi:uncharacterized protein (DUF1499 family)